jgi:alkylation response protein AidB-like acyl-CoA dehydrogenase
VPVWKHEAISHRIADMAATAFAMDAVSKLAARLADRGGYDIRLEAAAAKEWNSVRGWELIDQTLQIRGGRGYETEASLAGRGETPVAVERILRDCRINLIFEGSSEVMHLFMAREAVDKHLQVAGAMIDPKNGFKEKLAALPNILKFYAGWYPPLWFRGLGTSGRYSDFGKLARHLRFVERSARKLARESFHGMTVFQAKMERKQGFLFRTVDIVMELFAMSAAVSKARSLSDTRSSEAERALDLADLFCRNSSRKVRRLFRELWSNEDDRKNGVAARLMAGDFTWLEQGRLDVGLTPESFQTRFLTKSSSDTPRAAAAG